jgi:hypothetical protein
MDYGDEPAQPTGKDESPVATMMGRPAGKPADALVEKAAGAAA